MVYCTKCGTEVNEDDEFCPNCKAPLKRTSSHNIRIHGSRDHYGAVIGGLIITWLGVILLLRNRGLLTNSSFGGVFLLGVGIILILRGLLAIQETGIIDQGLGFFIGGAVLILIGLGVSYNLRDWWPLILICMGLAIIVKGITDRGGSLLRGSLTSES